MKFQFDKASSSSFKKDVEINTLEDLQKLSAENGGHDLVVDFKGNTITLYDGYLE